MTQIKTILDPVKNRTKDQLEKWEQIMSNYKELVCFIDVRDCAMVAIIWRIAENELTKYSTRKNTLRSRRIISTSNYLKNATLGGKVVQMTACW
jgi:hypothetical protein